MARGVRRARHALDRELIDLRHAHALVPRQVVELAPRRAELAHLLLYSQHRIPQHDLLIRLGIDRSLGDLELEQKD